MRTRRFAPMIAAALGACVTASVESRPLSPDELYSPEKGQTLEGVIYYEPRPYLLTYVFTSYDPNAGKTPRADPTILATDSCTRTIQMTQLQVLPDFAHPRIMTPLRYGIGTAKLSVTLSNGMLTAVNAEGSSTLADALKAVTSGIADVAGAVKGGAPPANPSLHLCNAGPALGKIEPIDWSKLPLVFGPDTTRKR